MAPRTLAVRARHLATIRPSYSGLAHILATVGIAGVVAITAFTIAGAYGGVLAWLALPVALVVANVVEWSIHRYVMHVPRRLLKAIYDEHAGRHHGSFTQRNMFANSRREWALVLMNLGNFVGLLAIAGVLSAIAGAFLGFGVSMVCLGTFTFYFALYEVTHLACHSPFAAAASRHRWWRAILAHHARHHDPRLMRNYNFNITMPLTDAVMGTGIGYGDPKRAAAERKAEQE